LNKIRTADEGVCGFGQNPKGQKRKKEKEPGGGKVFVGGLGSGTLGVQGTKKTKKQTRSRENSSPNQEHLRGIQGGREALKEQSGRANDRKQKKKAGGPP